MLFGGTVQTPDILVLGGPNSGKTHYGGQLYGRVQRRPGLLRLRSEQGTPTDLSAFKEVLDSLEKGCAARHTETGTWAEVMLPLTDVRGNAVDLRWPDYGGEQFRAIFDKRATASAWQNRLDQANRWVVLIRLNSETTYPDALKHLCKKADGAVTHSVRAGDWDANARWVETFQIMLHIAGVDTVRRINNPRLCIMLSCYDELAEPKEKPIETLAEKLPLVASFIESTWMPEAVSVWGLSALGCPLEKTSENENFAEEGPEYQGWVIRPDGGARQPDLTEPLAWLLGA
jgi:Double-GTPase 1